MQFKDTVEIKGFFPTVAKKPIAEQFEEDYFLLDEVDWFWRNFFSDENKGLYATLVEPIAGDFNRIAENGEAWKHVADNFRAISANLTDNVHVVLRDSWSQGQAAEAFQSLVENIWSLALFVAEEMSDFMGAGFVSLSEGLVNLAEVVVKLLAKIVNKIKNLAARAISGLGGVIAKAVEWVATGFEKFPYWEDVREISAIVSQVLGIHKTVQKLTDVVKQYIKSFLQAFDAIKAIPDINSTQDGFSIIKDVRDGTSGMEKQVKEYRENKGKLAERKSRIDDTLNPGPDSVEKGGSVE